MTSVSYPGSCVARASRAASLRRDPRQLARRFHFPAQPFRRNVKAIRPGQRAEFEKYAHEIDLIAQGSKRGAGLIDQRGEIVDALATVAEPDAQAKAAKPFDSCGFSQHRDLRFSPAVRLPAHVANYRATRPG